MEELDYHGASSTFFREGTGVVLKLPRHVWHESQHREQLVQRFEKEFFVERTILERLGEHPRIVKSAYLKSVVVTRC
jgi:hypothetical protein